jgi:undecaprenyl-diphosphatase
MIGVTNDWFLRILYGVAMILILIKGNKQLRWTVLVSAFVLLLTDQLSASILKPLFERARPCHEGQLEVVRLLVRCGGGLSMPSAHAANVFGQAILYGLLYNQVRLYLLLFAFIVSISRVFVGVHYPFDVVGGIVLGSLLGYIGILLFNTVIKKRI